MNTHQSKTDSARVGVAFTIAPMCKRAEFNTAVGTYH